MIEIFIRRNKQGHISSFSVSGHAGYAEHGEDIVCAGVSALAQTGVLGLTQVLGIKADCRQQAGELACVWPDLEPETQAKAAVLLETILLGFIAIRENYAPYVRIHDSKEV